MRILGIAGFFSGSKKSSEKAANEPLGSSVLTIFILSSAVNTLFLTGPIYMMQVYDRVLGSGSVPTLLGLSAIALIMYLMLGFFDTLRQQIATLRGEEVSARYDGPAFRASLDAAAAGVVDERSNAPEDVESVRGFATSPAMMTFYDLPAIPFYFLAVMMLHPVLGMFVMGAAFILAGLAFMNDRSSRQRMSDAQKKLSGVSSILSSARKDSESLKANGMIGAAQTYWQNEQKVGRSEMVSSMLVTSAFSTGTKSIRMAIQSMVLGVGAWLAIAGALSPGAMIAASIVFSRSIAPFEQLLNNFRTLVRARDAWARVQVWAPDYVDKKAQAFDLPAPAKSLIVDNLSVKIPGQDKNLLTGISVNLEAGDILSILGSSGVGKTSLARTIVGAWAGSHGSIRIDGAELSQWPADQLGEHVGYLSQYTNLLNGTVAQNISRFRPNATSESVIQAAQIASVHEMILGFDDGYKTRLGDGAVMLSGGQRQRIGLARAIYGAPFLAVLDEPSAHLDAPGKVALAKALLERRRAGKITIITSHDPALLNLVTKVMVLESGKMTVSGPRDAVLKKMEEMKAAAANQQAPQKLPAQKPQAQKQSKQKQATQKQKASAKQALPSGSKKRQPIKREAAA